MLNIIISLMTMIFPPGECCFQLFTEESGQGGSQLLDSSGEFRLKISPVRSLYMVECVRYLIADSNNTVNWIFLQSIAAPSPQVSDNCCGCHHYPLFDRN